MSDQPLQYEYLTDTPPSYESLYNTESKVEEKENDDCECSICELFTCFICVRESD